MRDKKDESRPDPEALLARIKRQEERGSRGRLKIFFGMAAGVGKTYAMLNSALRLKDAGIDIIIHFVDIGVGMMEDIVLLPPEKVAAAHQVQGEAHQPVDAPVFRIAAVVAVVHDIKASHGKSLGECERGKDGRDKRICIKYEEDIGGNQPGEYEAGLEEHTPVAGSGKIVFMKVSIDTLLQNFAELITGGEMDVFNRNYGSRTTTNRDSSFFHEIA